MFKNIILIFLLSVLFSPAYPLPKCPGEKRVMSTWINCTGTYKAVDGHTYSGAFDSKGKYKGYGVLKTGNGGVLEGEFLNNKMHGQGKQTMNHPTHGVNYYEGEWFMGNWHGKGILWSEDGIFKYEGEFQNMEMTGYGTLTYDGVTKTGNFKNAELID